MTEAADDIEALRMFFAEKVRAILQPARHGKWSPEIARHFAEVLKSLARHADHFHGKTADHHLCPDDVRTASKHALPCLVTENDHCLTPRRAGILREQRTAQLRADAKHLKVISCHKLPLKSMSCYSGIDILDGRDFREHWILLFKLAVFIPREGMSATLTVCPRKAVEAVRIAYRD